jgi:hypothetical protein
MRDRFPIQSLAVVGVLAIVATAGAQTQTKAAAPVPSSAYSRLSLGNQKVASALYQAQTPMMGTTARPYSLEQIAAKRRGGQGWGQIFRELKAQGLVHEMTLGQVVARYLQITDAAPSVVSIDSGGDRSSALESGSNGYASDAARGVVRGGK